MHISKYILLNIITSASIKAAVLPSQEISLQQRDIISDAVIESHKSQILSDRALPPCKPCSKKARDLSDDLEIDPADLEEAKRSLTSRATVAKDFIPPICNKGNVNCMYLGKTVKFIRGGIQKPIGHWVRADGSQVYAWNYWQSTLLFAGPGGSATTYPAHDTVYTCVRGKMFAHIYDIKTDMRGNGKGNDKDPLVCKCICPITTDQFFNL